MTDSCLAEHTHRAEWERFLRREIEEGEKEKRHLWWLCAVCWLQRGGGTCEDVVEGSDEDDGRQGGAVSATGSELSEDLNEQLRHAHTHAYTDPACCSFPGIKGCGVVKCSPQVLLELQRELKRFPRSHVKLPFDEIHHPKATTRAHLESVAASPAAGESLRVSGKSVAVCDVTRGPNM